MGVFQSKDNGETWKTISSGIEEKNYVVKKVIFARNIAFATIKAYKNGLPSGTQINTLSFG